MIIPLLTPKVREGDKFKVAGGSRIADPSQTTDPCFPNRSFLHESDLETDRNLVQLVHVRFHNRDWHWLFYKENVHTVSLRRSRGPRRGLEFSGAGVKQLSFCTKISNHGVGGVFAA